MVSGISSWKLSSVDIFLLILCQTVLSVRGHVKRVFQPQYSCGPPLSRELTREKHERLFMVDACGVQQPFPCQASHKGPFFRTNLRPLCQQIPEEKQASRRFLRIRGVDRHTTNGFSEKQSWEECCQQSRRLIRYNSWPRQRSIKGESRSWFVDSCRLALGSFSLL
jgi:hypothetical protein